MAFFTEDNILTDPIEFGEILFPGLSAYINGSSSRQPHSSITLEEGHFKVVFCLEGNVDISFENQPQKKLVAGDISFVCTEDSPVCCHLHQDTIIFTMTMDLAAFCNAFDYTQPSFFYFEGDLLRFGDWIASQQVCTVVRDKVWSRSVISLLNMVPKERAASYIAMRALERAYIESFTSVPVQQQ